MTNNKSLIYIELANEKSLIKDYRQAIEELTAIATASSLDTEISYQQQLNIVSHIVDLTLQLNVEQLIQLDAYTIMLKQTSHINRVTILQIASDDKEVSYETFLQLVKLVKELESND